MSDRVVIDSSVAIKWVVPEDGTREALAQRSKFQLFAPELMIAEIANILWKKCQRGELSEDEASIAADLLSQAGIVYLPMNTLLPKVTELAIKLSHPAYDCIYLERFAFRLTCIQRFECSSRILMMGLP